MSVFLGVYFGVKKSRKKDYSSDIITNKVKDILSESLGREVKVGNTIKGYVKKGDKVYIIDANEEDM